VAGFRRAHFSNSCFCVPFAGSDDAMVRHAHFACKSEIVLIAIFPQVVN